MGTNPALRVSSVALLNGKFLLWSRSALTNHSPVSPSQESRLLFLHLDVVGTETLPTAYLERAALPPSAVLQLQQPLWLGDAGSLLCQRSRAEARPQDAILARLWWGGQAVLDRAFVGLTDDGPPRPAAPSQSVPKW